LVILKAIRLKPKKHRKNKTYHKKNKQRKHRTNSKQRDDGGEERRKKSQQVKTLKIVKREKIVEHLANC